jgi:hypothetical protein
MKFNPGHGQPVHSGQGQHNRARDLNGEHDAAVPRPAGYGILFKSRPSARGFSARSRPGDLPAIKAVSLTSAFHCSAQYGLDQRFSWH